MFESPHKLHRLAADKASEYRREAEIARLAAAARSEPGWRWRLGETLLALATRLSPEHRNRLQRLGDQLGDQLGDPSLSDLSDCNATA